MAWWDNWGWQGGSPYQSGQYVGANQQPRWYSTSGSYYMPDESSLPYFSGESWLGTPVAPGYESMGGWATQLALGQMQGTQAQRRLAEQLRFERERLRLQEKESRMQYGLGTAGLEQTRLQSLRNLMLGLLGPTMSWQQMVAQMPTGRQQQRALGWITGGIL